VAAKESNGQPQRRIIQSLTDFKIFFSSGQKNIDKKLRFVL